MKIKEKILAQLSSNRKSLTKYNMSLMSDLKTAVEDMNSYDLESSHNNASSEYENALGLMEQARVAADKYIESSREFDDDMSMQWDSYTTARDLYFEVSNQLQDLGVPESPELSDLGNAVANGEEAGQKAYSDYENGFSEHNELVDI